MMISKLTDTQGHYVRQAAPATPVEPSDFKTHRVGGRSTAGANESERSARSAGSDDRTTINRLDSQNAERNQSARRIRAFDQAMEKVGSQIRNMKKELNVIVKNYPPFPPGSEERIARLRRFNSFRKQIEQLTIPPAREEKHTKVDPPSSPHIGMQQGSLVIEAVEGDGYAYSVRSVDASAVRVAVKLPELPEDASDSKVQATLGALEKASAALQAQRQSIAAVVHRTYGGDEDSEFFIVTENKAEAHSHSLRNDLAIMTHGSLTAEPAQLVGLLN